QEAEAALRKGVPYETELRRIALSRETLGLVLLEEQRWSDALACFEACVRDWPDRGCSRRAIAETKLRQGDVAEAVSHARAAVETDRTAKALNPEVHDVNLSEALATLAWAVAEHSGDKDEVDRLLGEALPLCEGKAKPAVAQVNYYAGR